MATYQLTESAKNDILAISVFTIETFGEAQARRYHQGLETAFRFLADNPEAARERFEIDPPIRAYPYQSHIIIYEINSDGDVIILRVVHGSSDWQ
jgi:toxin ParE1/3/4